MAMTGKTQEELLTEELWSAAEQGDLQEVRKRSEYGAADMTLFDENHHNTLWCGVKSGNASYGKTGQLLRVSGAAVPFRTVRSTAMLARSATGEVNTVIYLYPAC